MLSKDVEYLNNLLNNLLNSSTWDKEFMVEELPSQEVSATQSAAKPDDGALWFFFVDAFEDDRSNPPRVYLFGKVQNVTGGFSSCCLVVEQLERCAYLLLRATAAEAELVAGKADAEFDALCQKFCPTARKLRSKLKWRNYAFEKALPSGGGRLPFLKVVCEAAGGLPPLSGEHFSHAFGANSSLLERLVLTKRIMGPSWLRIKPGSFRQEAAKLSYCAVEFRVTPDSFHAPRTEADCAELAKHPAMSPPLRMMSLSLQTIRQSAESPHEVVAVACTLHPNVSPDASGSDSEQKRCGRWGAIRRLNTNPFPRDADKVGT